MQTTGLGRIAEDKAVEILVSQGYKIIGRNFRSRFGEIDIIALKGNELVFVEVKARWNLKFGFPEEAVTPSKLSKIQKTSEYYVLLNQGLPAKHKIIVISLMMEREKVAQWRIIDVY